MPRRFITILMIVALCWTTVACSSPTTLTQSSSTSKSSSVISPNQVNKGTYPVQQASYDDADGTYTLMLLNTPAGTSSAYRTADLQMARLTDEQIANGDQTSVEVTGNEAIMFLTKDFKIEYVHTVTETQTNPQTGQPQSVVVHRESNFWTPFAGALVGQAVGNLLFSPRYYVPPMYQSGGIIRGYGGYGNTYTQAVDSYRSRYNAPPAAVQNREILRTSGNLRRSPSTSRSSPNSSQSSGSGVGSSRLKTSGRSKPTTRRRSGFGSSYPRSRSRSFGSRRR
ncbi:MAG: hypothetical protein ACTMUB_07960 [cyanobacterium endosymbiont of Rhopalodia musculus]|uniref:hypothetical protein n=1 Tax=cyanobacterium endosymbiont of Epithemia clementina EcSB TaxID=3034674 RepID=UPI0024812543|nr:hypothetical protein [cyanobacterium endosymbiont of Epithemia clementina EcSB]WGT68020.1 hypothetical protein P3F56_02765 [cyanobacterium endosymbiont of Epithemia clementina EcSB]